MRKKVAMKYLLVLFYVFFAKVAFSEDICPTKADKPWDKMDESFFSKEAAIKQLEALNDMFNRKIEVAEEFIYQSNLVIEGAFYRMEIDNWKNDPKNLKYAKERFCKFMAERAYLVH